MPGAPVVLIGDGLAARPALSRSRALEAALRGVGSTKASPLLVPAADDEHRSGMAGAQFHVARRALRGPLHARCARRFAATHPIRQSGLTWPAGCTVLGGESRRPAGRGT